MFRPKYIVSLLIFIVVAALFVQSSNIVATKLSLGEVSSKDVQAPKSITFIDEDETDKLKQDTVNQIQKVYDQDKSVSQSLISDLKTTISNISTAHTTINSRKELEKSNLDFDLNLFTNNTLNEIKTGFNLTLVQKKALLALSQSDLEKLEDMFSSEVERILSQGITADSLELARKQFSERADYYYFPLSVRDAIVTSISAQIVPNLLFNKEETDKRIKEELDKTKPVYKVIKKGEMVLRKGEVISQDQLEKLTKLGLVKSDFDYEVLLKNLPLIGLFFILFHFYCYLFHSDIFSQFKIYLFIFTLFIFVLSCESFIEDTRFLLIPFLTALMIIISLWGRLFTIFCALILGLLLSLKVGNDYSFLLLMIISSVLLAFSFNSKGTRNDLFLSSLITGVSLVASFWIINYSMEIVLDYTYLIKSSAYLLLFSFGSAILSVGSLYLIERLLGLITHARLYELTDQNHPLLRELQKNAPGTYSHSIMVANLAEMAADEIGANGILVRAAAFFHDVGKLKNPKFFIENSSPEDNIHLQLDPLSSAKIILEHPHESIRLCKEYKIPELVTDVISSHHGDSLVRFFYTQAKELGLEPIESDYQYTTPVPKTKEQGILMLSDSVEAFSRTLYGKGKEDFGLAIRRMVFDKIERGELRECDLNFGDLEKIVTVFSSYLFTVPHLRLSYPK